MNSGTAAKHRPETSEYAPYYGRYVSLVTTDDILAALRQQISRTTATFSKISEGHGNYSYAPDKWTVKQVLGHMIDVERIMSYRALSIARGDQTPLPGFEQDDYVASAGFNEISIAALLEELAAVRNATVLLFQQLNADAWGRQGIASNNKVSVRALAYIIAGHELHHLQVLNEKYLPALGRTGQVVGKT
jgi:hypothetical protein